MTSVAVAATVGRASGNLFGRLPTRLAGLGAAAAVLLLACLGSLALGSAELELGTVVGAFTAFDGSNGHLIVLELRLPRTLIGLGVGAALGLAGCVMQGVTRNPLAEPGILGINAGASLAVVIAIALLGIAQPADYVWFALAGAALASVLVYALGLLGRGGAAPLRLVLAGAVLAALLTSLTSAILVLDANTLDQFRFWAVGSIAGRDLGVLAAVLPFLVLGGALALVSGRQLNALSLGDDVARSLGQRVGIVRLALAASVVFLAGVAVAAAGPIAFVGLAVPHAARALVGSDYRWLLPYSAVLGPALLLASDILGRILARPGELQVGIMTALIGAPVLIWLVRQRRLAQV
ncbi:MAG: FecCD family ABC transporter permease [Candidatus Limnocylindria bacterium]